VVAWTPTTRRPGVGALWAVGGCAIALLVGYSVGSHVRYAALLAALPLLVLAAARPHVPLLAGVALLPFPAIGIGVGGTQVTAADMLFLVALASAVFPLLLNRNWRDRARDAGPLLLAAAPLAAWLAAVMAFHSSTTVTINGLQTYQIFAFPLVLGAVVLLPQHARIAAALFAASSVILALTWVVSGGEGLAVSGNKNPAGQYIADAVILVLALAPTWRSRVLCLVPLGAGLIFTQSRGALLGAGVGIVALLLLRGLGSWRRTLTAVVPLAALVVVGFFTLPDDVLARSTDFSSASPDVGLGDLTAAQRSVQLRETFRDQGWALVDAHPVFGVGPGNYLTGAPGTEEITIDPHNLVIRTAGDLGYPGLVSFGLLVAVTALLALRRRGVNRYAALAIAVQVAVLVHGFVDVYWVRGTPVLPWLLLGMAMNLRLDGRRV
jgi:O-antigen ligase